MRDGGGAKESRGDALYRTQSMSKTSFFVCEWLLQDCRPTNHVMTPLASPRAKARTHLGAATCLGPADATPPWGPLYKSRSLGPACPGPGASSVLSLALWPPSSARIPARWGAKTRQRTGRTNSQVTHRWSQSSLVGLCTHPRASQRPKHRTGITRGRDRAVGSVSLAGCRLQMAAGLGERGHVPSVDMDGGNGGNTREGR